MSDDTSPNSSARFIIAPLISVFSFPVQSSKKSSTLSNKACYTKRHFVHGSELFLKTALLGW